MKIKINFRLFYAIILMLCIVWTVFGCASNQSAVPYHQGLQRELTYDNAINKLEAFTTKSAKEDQNRLKKDLKAQKNQNAENNKRKTIEQKNAELRAKIEEAKKNNQ